MAARGDRGLAQTGPAGGNEAHFLQADHLDYFFSYPQMAIMDGIERTSKNPCEAKRGITHQPEKFEGQA
jgi:hypothetical protein